MADIGLNAVRTYTLPTDDVLGLAAEAGLRVIVGLDYPDWRYELQPGGRTQRRVRDAGLRAVDEAMERCARRPDVLAISVGNEVPGDVVRVHGRGAVEDGLGALVEAVHAADPAMLATYTNFPTTEYLDVEGQDLVSFNVFLEDRQKLRRYLRRLQVVSGDRPLLISELGLGSALHGEEAQAESLAWQLREVDEAGCAGASVFGWTDEWTVAGHDVGGWGFGLTHEDRRAKPALAVVGRWAQSTVGELREQWPRVSVVVCAHNGDQLIARCLASLERSDYPDLEVIVCDDGSTDGTLAIAEQSPFMVLRLPRGGLSAARNAGLAAATGEIVAFLDADAHCHPEWPYRLALSLEDENVVATGGPNLPVSGVGFVERAVGASPGGPVEVLLGDDRAEHVPGCNMAFEREALLQIGGFDPIFTAAGDDVDVCWKLLDAGREIAFAPAAQVRHHRRDTLGGYLRQQVGYGKAERLLSGRHRHRFNSLGQARWAGFVYGGARALGRLLRPVVYHGRTGSALFQPVVGRPAEQIVSRLGAYVPLAAALAVLGLLASLSLWWLAAPALTIVLLMAYGATVAFAVRPDRGEPHPLRFRLFVGLLHLLQPLARAWGRLCGARADSLSEAPPHWLGDRLAWIETLGRELSDQGCTVKASEAHDRWDLDVTVGPLMRCRLTTAVVWNWQPLYRRVVRLRPASLVVLVPGFAVMLLNIWSGLFLVGAVFVAAGLEAVRLRRSCGKAIRRTTAGFEHPPDSASGAADLVADLDPADLVRALRGQVQTSRSVARTAVFARRSGGNGALE